MLLAEDRIDVLVDRLADLPTLDRRAVLAHLSRPERARVATLMAAAPALPATSPFSVDLAARITDGADLLTVAARESLARAAARSKPVTARARLTHRPSLFQVLRQWLPGGW